MDNNTVTMVGRIETPFTRDHEYYGETFYRFTLTIKRTSNTVDHIPMIISERLVDTTQDLTGAYVSVKGELRSFNSHELDKVRLLLYVFPIELQIIGEYHNVNEAVLCGTICKPPIYRETPKGRLITDITLAVNRLSGKSDYIPCIAWGRNAYFTSTLYTGDQIRVAGRIQSREYTKDGNVKTAYELSVSMVEVI